MGKSVLDNILELRFSEDMDWKTLLTKMSGEAIAKGWAKEGFTEAICTRESKYATGLQTSSSIDIAIPHADAEWANEPAMIAAILDKPVIFEPMGGMGDQVNARFVFMLVITDPNAHIDFLQAICGFIEDEACMKELNETKDLSKLIDYLKASM